MQEVDRFNILIRTMESSLNDITRAIEGEIIMSEELDIMHGALLKNQVPPNWVKKAYPS